MGVICYASDVIEYNRRKPGLSNAPLHMNQDTTSIEKKTLKPRLRLILRLILRLTCRGINAGQQQQRSIFIELLAVV